MAKHKTNEQSLNTLLKELHPFQAAMLRERIMKISQLTRDSIKENPGAYDNPIFHHTQYLKLCDLIDQHLKFNS